MFSTSYLTVAGLLLEMIGLSLLFFDLLKSKNLSDSSAALHTLQEDLNVSTRDLLINLNKQTTLLARFMSDYAGVLAREAEFKEEVRENAENHIEPDDRQKLINFCLDTGPFGLRQSMARQLQSAIKALPTESKTAEAIALNTTTLSELIRNQEKYSSTSLLLRRVATLGVGLVGTGATLQFLDLFF